MSTDSGGRSGDVRPSPPGAGRPPRAGSTGRQAWHTEGDRRPRRHPSGRRAGFWPCRASRSHRQVRSGTTERTSSTRTIGVPSAAPPPSANASARRASSASKASRTWGPLRLRPFPEQDDYRAPRPYRGRSGRPSVGVFAGRGPRGPDRIGVTCCAIESVDGHELAVVGLAAVSGTPIIDLRPTTAESVPANAEQPQGVNDLMSDCFRP
ncbi:TrmO family methyltransferase [Streptomyces sp. NPDC002580]|uniref:TrmO family methyltransferase domain-containing protein n=1 Tax=Streptomyces sp. NPDC002580 TaxID=3364653 RepID=UPI0036A340A7